MPPIKRTKFKLSPEQLLEMFYWLKLIRAFDERLSILVKQGKVRSGVYTGIGQEAIIVGTCYGLRKEDYICPLHRDLGAFLMKGVEARVMMAQMFAKDTGLSKGRDSALHSGVNELGIFGNTSMLKLDANGRATEMIDTPQDLPRPVAMAVTLEPEAGVPAPTGDKYLVGLAN